MRSSWWSEGRQLIRVVELTVVVRWAPRLSVRCGTRMARRARTSASDAGHAITHGAAPRGGHSWLNVPRHQRTEGAAMAWGQQDRPPGLAVAAPSAVSWLQLAALNPGPAVDAAGESHYQDTLESIAGGRNCFGVHTPLITAELVREPTNPTTRRQSESRLAVARWDTCRRRTPPASTASSTSWPDKAAPRPAAPG
jgi:hypothetical protein